MENQNFIKILAEKFLQGEGTISELGRKYKVKGKLISDELRSQGYAYEHTLFTSIEKLNNNVGKKRTKRNNDLLLNYTVDEVDLSKMENAKPANEVLIKYSNVNKTGYTYDAENKVYKRTVNGKEHVDYVWALLEEFVYYDYQLFNREPIIENLKRKVVLGLI